MNSQAIEDYLKAIYKLQDRNTIVTTSALAEHIKVSPASATGMIKKLATSNLVKHERYQGVTLTESGKKIALEVIRHHRLLELYLAEALGMSWDKVHDEAEKWEHILSEELEDRIDEILGYPTSDPHGAPIPNRDGIMDDRHVHLLSELLAGDQAIITEVSDDDAEMLRYLGKLQLYPKTEIEVVSIAPFDDLLTIRRKTSDNNETNNDDEDFIIGQSVANCIFVTLMTTKGHLPLSQPAKEKN